MDVELNSSTFHSQHMQVKDKKRIRRDSAKSKEHSASGKFMLVFWVIGFKFFYKHCKNASCVCKVVNYATV